MAKMKCTGQPGLHCIVTQVHLNWLFCGGGQDPGRKGGRRCMGGGRTRGGKWDSQGGRKQEKLRKIMQYCTKFCNRKKCKRGGANKNRAGTGI